MQFPLEGFAFYGFFFLQSIAFLVSAFNYVLHKKGGGNSYPVESMVKCQNVKEVQRNTSGFFTCK